jgi:Bacteriophage baseplate protein W
MAQLDSATDLLGDDQGGGDVALTWAWPGDIVAQSVVFDVFGSDDGLDVFHTRYAHDVAALHVTLTGFGFSGDRYFTVVAKRLDQLSLPARILRMFMQPPPVSATPVSGSSDESVASGVGFPFGITTVGGVFAQGGDALLRGKLLQLLLTVPGERVNLPDYGTRLMDLVFDPNSDVLAATTEFTVTRAIQRYLGDEIQVSSVRVSNDEATLNVDINYVKKTDLRPEQVRIGLPLPLGATS